MAPTPALESGQGEEEAVAPKGQQEMFTQSYILTDFNR